MKTQIVLAFLVVASAVSLFAQAEQVKKKAKDLKRDVETKQTNDTAVKTNAPVRLR